MENQKPSSSSPLTLTDLNADALAHCASFLSLADVSNLAATCKPLRHVTYSDAVWRRLYTERWPFECISCGAEGVRETYFERHVAVNQLKFSDPMRVVWSQYPMRYSHVLLRKHEAFLAQGSIVQNVRLESPDAAVCCGKTLTGHNARITCMRLFPIGETSLSRSAMQNEENALVTSSSDRTIRIWWKVNQRGNVGAQQSCSNTALTGMWIGVGRGKKEKLVSQRGRGGTHQAASRLQTAIEGDAVGYMGDAWEGVARDAPI